MQSGVPLSRSAPFDVRNKKLSRVFSGFILYLQRPYIRDVDQTEMKTKAEMRRLISVHNIQKSRVNHVTLGPDRLSRVSSYKIFYIRKIFCQNYHIIILTYLLTYLLHGAGYSLKS